MLKLYNSLSRKTEEFIPLSPPAVTLYTCGPTVYDFPHIGHGRKYVGDDVLKRTLTLFGFKVNHVMNITDVGHLVSDGDEGEDKLEKGAAREGKSVWDVARFFEDEFHRDMKKLNILFPHTVAHATKHIPEQIKLVKTLIEKGYAYDTDEAVYFDISKFDRYDTLFGQPLVEKEVAVREEVQTGEHKKHPSDFALWFKRTGRFANHTMHWESPWGDGFPGWHIECSAMSMKYLGETIDIHTGGIDHLSIHHPNEIAQSEAATGKPFVRFWIHHNFLMVDNQKMSKSLNNFYRIAEIESRGFEALDLRYLYLTTHYRKVLNFTWDALSSARTARKKLIETLYQIHHNQELKRTILSHEKLGTVGSLRDRFIQALANDLNMPQALSVVWETIKSNIPSEDKYDLIQSFDEVMGLNLVGGEISNSSIEVPEEIRKLVERRNRLRSEQKWDESDQVRKEIEEKGWMVEDSSEGTNVRKKY